VDMRSSLARWAFGKPRVLLVDGPQTDSLRWTVEREIDRRGWLMAQSPAGADLLITLGYLGPELGAATDILWSQLPRPRHRTSITAAPVPEQLDAALKALHSPTSRSEDEPADPEQLLNSLGSAESHDSPDHGHDLGSHDDQEMNGGEDSSGPAAGDHADHNMDEHAGHDTGEHAGHDMDHMHGDGMIAGLPMAQISPDRDGLELDRLAVRLGPWLPGWPTGLMVRGSLQGDVLTDVNVEWADSGHQGHTVAAPLPGQAAALDHLARFLLVAGWSTAARQGRAARDGLLSPSQQTVVRARRAAETLARRVARSHLLSWSVRGIASLPPQETQTQPAGTEDVMARIRHWCTLATGRGDPASLPTISLVRLSQALEGLELASARLAVASVGVEQVTAPRPGTAAHG